MDDQSVVEVYRAKNGAQAHRFVAVLSEAGIQAEIQGELFHPAASTADNLFTESAPWFDAPRILVLAGDAARARAMILDLEASERERAGAAEEGPSIKVVCEECGEATAFPAGQRGSVQSCEHCGAYVDVEEPEEQ